MKNKTQDRPSLGTKASAVRKVLVDQTVLADGVIDPNDPQDIISSMDQVSIYLSPKFKSVFWMTRDTLKVIVETKGQPLPWMTGTDYDKLSGVDGYLLGAPVLVDDSVPILERKWAPLTNNRVFLLTAKEEDYATLCGNRRR